MLQSAHFGRVAHLRADPNQMHGALEVIENGALLVNEDGRIDQTGPRDKIITLAPDARQVDHGDAWLLPGLIDGHVHYPQFYATAAAGTGLLDWLNRSIFPSEAALADPDFAEQLARDFVRRLLRSGTTTAAVFGSQYQHANSALFDAADAGGLRMIAGATLMDQGAPQELLQTPEQAHAQCTQLIRQCLERPRLHYAVTPRFALSCSEAMLEMCGTLLREFPDVYLQTHINESPGEIEAVHRMFPWARHYLDVYDRFGLLGEQALLAHSIHTGAPELTHMAEARAAVCHCPGSNLYLGSGLFPLRAHQRHGLKLAVGTDIGAGTHFSVWNELSECYKVQQLQGHTLGVAELLYLGTLGGAEALGLAAQTGNFAAGKCADFLVLATEGDDYLEERLRRCESQEDQLFCLIHLAGPCHMKAVYANGREVTEC